MSHRLPHVSGVRWTWLDRLAMAIAVVSVILVTRSLLIPAMVGGSRVMADVLDAFFVFGVRFLVVALVLWLTHGSARRTTNPRRTWFIAGAVVLGVALVGESWRTTPPTDDSGQWIDEFWEPAAPWERFWFFAVFLGVPAVVGLVAGDKNRLEHRRKLEERIHSLRSSNVESRREAAAWIAECCLDSPFVELAEPELGVLVRTDPDPTVRWLAQRGLNGLSVQRLSSLLKKATR